jgi:hypothetical protein
VPGDPSRISSYQHPADGDEYHRLKMKAAFGERPAANHEDLQIRAVWAEAMETRPW